MSRHRNKEGLNVLILEDVPTDAEVVVHALRSAHIEFSSRRVDHRDDFVRALEENPPDVILADYKLPSFDGLTALQLVKQKRPDTPVIIVTGVLSDEDAVELLREGASDYILKDRLSRLAPAVRRALHEARVAAEKREAEERYRALFVEALDGIVLIDCNSGHIVDCNAEFERQTGRTLPSLKDAVVWELGPAEQTKAARSKMIEIAHRGSGGATDLVLRRPDRTDCLIEFRAKVIVLRGKRYIQILCRDITERKAAERALREQLDELRRFQKVAVDRELRMEELERELERLSMELAKVK